MRAFVDSNVTVYALASDDADPRRGMAMRLLGRHAADQSLVLSVQVLLETYNVLVRKKKAAPAHALAAMRLLARHEVVSPSADAVLRALELAARHRLSTWDALIVQAALEAGCDVLYSEDLQAGRHFGALQVVNPFALQVQETGPAYAAPRKVALRRASKGPAKARKA